MRIIWYCILAIGSSLPLWGQQTVVSGKITDGRSGDPIPFANVVIQGTDQGTTTDFSGFYTLTFDGTADSLVVSYIGYKTRAKALRVGQTQSLNFQLQEQVEFLKELVFVAEENPAHAIMDQVIAHKTRNDKKSLEAYEYESYTKIEIALDNLSERFRERKIVQKVKKVIDSVDQIAGEDGQAILPVFISESLSDFYFRNQPELEKEHIKKTKITGVGVEDGTLISQFIGSSFQEYNFYENWLTIWNKKFVSPIAEGWRGYYQVYLMDSLWLGNHFCYRMEVVPKRAGDLAFNGTIWVTKKDYALKQLDLWIDKKTNLNFIERMKLQQELEPTSAGPWIPAHSRILTDFQLLGEFGLGNKAAGILAKFYISNEDIEVNKPREPRFYDLTLDLAEDATQQDENFWKLNRHQPLTTSEINVMNMIDTLKQIPPVKRLTDFITFLGTGYVDVGKFELGPYPLVYANNNIEGNRFRLGARTTIDLIKNWELNGYLAYGDKDKDWKYQAGVKHILSRKPWSEIGVYSGRDIQQVGLTFDDVFSDINTFAFEAYFRNRDHEQPYYLQDQGIQYWQELRKGLHQKVILRHRDYRPINIDSTFNYAYKLQPELVDSPLRQNFAVTELALETRYGKDELWVQNDNNRFSIGPEKWPVVTLRYTLGLNNFLGGDFTYHKAAVNVYKKMKMGFLGVSRVSLTGEKIFGEVPLPLMKGHIGNESPFYIGLAYNTMGFSEFVSDQYFEINYSHHFEGFLFNRIPLFKKLKWRAVATGNVLWGSVSDDNLALHSSEGVNGLPNAPINALDNTPYVEVGYGIENIFRLFRVDAIHRLTYLDDRMGDKFALRFSFEFNF